MKRKGKRAESLKSIEIKLVVAFSVIVLFVVLFLTIVILDRSSSAIRSNSSRLIEANSKQLQYNINSYFEKVETTAALLFSDEAYYKFDATDTAMDKYTKLQKETGLSARIVDIGIMQNFSDFGIIYSDDHTVGWISNVTKNTFSDTGLYESAINHITRGKTLDGWFFGENDNLDRIYYVKRLNRNAVLLASFYTRELSNVFELPNELSDMNIRLVDDDNVILYSAIKEEIGGVLPESIATHVGGATTLHVSESEHIIDVNTCANGWKVVCDISTNKILSDVINLQKFAIYVATVISALFILFGTLVFLRVSRSARNTMNSLQKQASHDGLSGLLNKVAFEEIVEKELAKKTGEDSVVFAIMDVDHFKNVNDTLGHAYGDKVIARTADVLSRTIGKDAYIGRIGGDEFAFLFTTSDNSKHEIAAKMEAISEAFLNEFAKEHKNCGLSVSVGVVIEPYNKQFFDEVYKKADAALYVSKKRGRNQYTFYMEDSGKNEK